MINLRIIKNPFKPYEDSLLKQVPHLPGEPVLHYLQAELLNPDEVEVILNCRVLEPEEYRTVIPEPEDYLAVLPQVAGGGGRGSKNILATVASIGLMFLTMGVGNLIEGAISGFTGMANWGFWAVAGAMGTQAIGGQLLSSMFPPPKSEEPPSATYGWGGIQPLVGQNQPAPVILGRMRAAGQVVSQHVSGEGSKQYLNLLIEAGEGPCDYEENGIDDALTAQNADGGNCYGIGKIEIGGNPIGNYTDILVYKRAGLNHQTAIPGFNDTYNDQELNLELTDGGGWSAVQTTTQTDAERLELTFSWPMGLYDINPNSGDTGDNWVDIEIRYKKHDAPDSNWVNWGTKRVTANTRQAHYQTVRIDLPAQGQYDVKCCKSGVLYNQTDEGDMTKTYWTQLSTVTPLQLCRPNKILLGIKALATNQLNGGRPVVTFELSRSKVWVYHPDEGRYEQQDAANPAWAAYWMLYRVYRLDNGNGQPEFSVRGIPADKLLYGEFQKWAAFCERRQLQVNIYFDAIQKLREALHYIEELGRGRVIPRGTRYGCIFDDSAVDDTGALVAAQMFTMANIELDSFSEQFVDVSDRATAIEVTYFDRLNHFERTTMLVPADGMDDAAALVNPTQITLTGCTDRDQAWREGKYRLRLNNLCCTASWTADVDAIVSSLGQVVLVQHDVPAWGVGGRLVAATADAVTLDNPVELESGKTYQMMIRLADDTLVTKTVSGVAESGAVVTVSIPFDTPPGAGDIYSFGEVSKVAKPFKLVDIKRSGDLKYTLTGLEYSEAVYSEAGTAPEIEYSYLAPLFEAVNVTAVEETFRQKDGTMINNLNCSWQCPRGRQADEFLVDYSVDGGTTWKAAGSTNETSFVIGNVVTGCTYLIKVRIRKGALVSSGTVSDPLEVLWSDLNPAAPTGLSYNWGGMDLKVYWGAVYTNAGGTVANDIRDYQIEVVVDGVLMRTEYTESNLYTYTWSKNVSDNNDPATAVTVRVYTRDFGNHLSQPAIIECAVPLPTAPALTAASGVAAIQLVARVSNTQLQKYQKLLIKACQTNEFDPDSDGTLIHDNLSTFYTHVVDFDATWYYRARIIDIYGQASPWSLQVSATADKIDESEMMAQILRLETTSEYAPALGALGNLSDGSKTSGVTFSQTTWIEQRFVGEQVFSYFRINTLTETPFYVQYFNEAGQAWVDCCGSAVSPKISVAGQNLDVPISPYVAARRIRVQLMEAATIYEIRFCTVGQYTDLYADKIKAGMIEANSLRIGQEVANTAIPVSMVGSDMLFHFNGNLISTRGDVLTEGVGTTDTTPPTITSGTISGNNYVDVNFSEGVYKTGTVALTATQFTLVFTKGSGTATAATIAAVKKNDNTVLASASALSGGETVVRVFLSITGTPNGLETVEIKPASGTSIYDAAGNAMLSAQTTGAKNLTDATLPTISSASLATTNAYMDVNFSEGVYNVSHGALTAAAFTRVFTQNSGGASAMTISSVKKNDSTTEASASALAGGETVIRVFFTVTGNSTGVETIEIKPASGTAIYDLVGNPMLSTQTTGAKALTAASNPELIDLNALVLWASNENLTGCSKTVNGRNLSLVNGQAPNYELFAYETIPCQPNTTYICTDDAANQNIYFYKDVLYGAKYGNSQMSGSMRSYQFTTGASDTQILVAFYCWGASGYFNNVSLKKVR